jgi:AraC family transcriptional regulator
VRSTTLEDYRERVLRVLLHIQRNLDGPLDLVELAGVAAFSPYHFHRVFRGMVGESLGGYVRRLRLERAAMSLKGNDRPVVEIALDAGYSSHEAFTRAFRAAFRATPSEYRELHSPEITPSADPHAFRPLEPEDPAMRVEIKQLEPLRVLFVRHVGPYSQCGDAWDKLTTWAGSEGMIGPGTQFIGLCWDDPEITPPDKVRYDACITIDRDIESIGEFGVQEIDGGPYAMTTHFGPYSEFDKTYVKLIGQWAPRSGRELRPLPCLEFYLNSPENTEPEDLVTDIYLPLEAW